MSTEMVAPWSGACTTVGLLTPTVALSLKLATAFPSPPRRMVMLVSPALAASWKVMLAMPLQKSKEPRHTVFSSADQLATPSNQ